MAYVIAEPCIGVKDTACVDACPVDCIHPKKDESDFEGAPQLYIDPQECIDCGACVPVCPVSAIFALDDLPAQWSRFEQINQEHGCATRGGQLTTAVLPVVVESAAVATASKGDNGIGAADAPEHA